MEHAIFIIISRIIGGGRKIIRPQQEKARREDQRKQMRVIVQEKLVVDFWDLIPMESVADNSVEQDTSAVTKDN